jgi:3-deoxy-D-manno-octulosonate 8-phosphate phosphatase (KDO 8-P phosphatase)
MTSQSGLYLRSRLQRRLLRPPLSVIRLVVCDEDGVLTDGGQHYNQSGDVAKRFDVLQGLATSIFSIASLGSATIIKHLLICNMSRE